MFNQRDWSASCSCSCRRPGMKNGFLKGTAGFSCGCLVCCVVVGKTWLCAWQAFERKWKWKSVSHVRLFVTPGLHSPWNSPGQNTGVGSLPLLQGIFPTQGWNSPGQNTGVGSLPLLQGIFPTQGSNPGRLHAGKSSLDYLKLSLQSLDNKYLWQHLHQLKALLPYPLHVT